MWGTSVLSVMKYLLNFCEFPDLIQEEAAIDEKTLQVGGNTATLEEG